MIELDSWWKVLIACIILLISTIGFTIGAGYLFALGMRLAGFY